MSKEATTGEGVEISNVEQALLLSIALLITVPILYVFRAYDHSALTSWQWVFTGPHVVRVIYLLIPALFGTYAISRLPVAGPYSIFYLIVLALAFVLPLWAEPEAVLDGSRYFVQAKSLKEHGIFFFFKEWGTSIPAWTDLPLLSFLYGLLFSLVGEGRHVIQAFNSLLFALTIALTFLIGKKLWDEDTGLQAGILLLGIPYLLMQVPLLLVDVPTMFFLTLAIYSLIQAIEKGGPAWTAAASLSIAAALFTKYSVWPMLAVMPVIAAVHKGRDTKKTLTRTVAVLGFSLVLFACVIAAKANFFLDQVRLLWTYQRPGLSRWHEGYVSAFLFQTHPLITGLALYGLWRAKEKKEKRFIIAAWFLVITLVLRIDRIRYLIPILPLFTLMASYGLNVIKDRKTRRFLCLSVAATSFVIAWAAYLPFLSGTSSANLEQAGRYLDDQRCASAEVYALPQKSSSGSTIAAIPLLDYFTHAKIVSPQDWTSLSEDNGRKTSSLRFTWEMKKPDFYGKQEEGTSCVVFISDGILERLPRGLSSREVKRFDARSEIFKYQTIVTVLTK